MGKSSGDLCQGPFLRKIILYTIPIILTGLLQLAFNAADLIVVGQLSKIGSVAVGAVGATGSLTHLFVNVFMGLSVGAGVAVAQGIGARDNNAVSQTVHTALPLAAVGGLILTVVGICFSEPMLRWMGTPAVELPLATLYMKIYFAGSIPAIVYNFGAAILRAAGDTKTPLIFLSVSGVLNVVLNIVFVTKCEMDVEGVALATVLSQLLSAVLVVVLLFRRKDACRIQWKKLRFHKKPLLKILRIGIPSGIQGSLFSIANVQIQSAVNSFGSTVLAGASAAVNLGNFPMIATNAFHQTSVNFVGQNMGANRFDNIKKIFRTCLLAAVVVGIAGGGLVTLLSKPLLSIYLPGDPEAVTYGVERICWIVLPVFLAGIMEIATGALRGMGASLAPMLTSVLGICALRVVWLYTVFARYQTPACLWMSFPISWLITFGALYVIYRIVFREKEREWRRKAEELKKNIT